MTDKQRPTSDPIPFIKSLTGLEAFRPSNLVNPVIASNDASTDSEANANQDAPPPPPPVDED